MDLTKKSLLKHCRDMDMYSTPELNEKLFLHQKGISVIENLGAYVGVKVLWLQQNAIQIVQGLDNLVELRHLYLNENLIKSINGARAFSDLTRLDTLNLEKNYICKIESADLANLEQLNTLNVAHNRLSEHSMPGLLQCPSICVLDLRNNDLKIDMHFIEEVLAKLPNLRVLYFMSTHNMVAANTIADGFHNYRKTLISKCANLRHLDDRPVFDDERRTCAAWSRGGMDEERKERTKIKQEKVAREEMNHQMFAKMVHDARMSKRALIAPDNMEESSGDDDEKVNL